MSGGRIGLFAHVTAIDVLLQLLRQPGKWLWGHLLMGMSNRHRQLNSEQTQQNDRAQRHRTNDWHSKNERPKGAAAMKQTANPLREEPLRFGGGTNLQPGDKDIFALNLQG